MLLASTPTRVTYGHRIGPVGVDQYTAVKKEGGRWTFANSGYCGPLTFAGRTAARLQSYHVQDRGLLVKWEGSRCLGGPPEPRPDVRVRESPDRVEVLVVRGSSSEQPPGQACAGLGTSEQTLVPLSAPLAGRPVENVGALPAEDVPSER